MERIRTAAFDAGKERNDRKPLVVRGARQVGKTWLVREWGRTRFDRVVEADLERHPQIRTCFSDNDPRATLGRLAAVHRDLLATLRDDFAKYSSTVHHRRLTAVLDSIPVQLGQ